MNAGFLKQVPLFAGLSDADLERLAHWAREVTVAPGELLFREGSIGDRAYVIKEGQVEAVKESAGREILLNVCGPGDVIGEIALLGAIPRTASIRARGVVCLLEISKDEFDGFLGASTEATRAVFKIVVDRWRKTESDLRHNEKMAQLGTLSAGVAHELNNPAAAVRRAAEHLQTAVAGLASAQAGLCGLALDDRRQALLESRLSPSGASDAGIPALDAMARSDLESQLEEWLEQQGVADPWNLAPALADMGWDISDVEMLALEFRGDQLLAALRYLTARSEVNALLHEISQGAGRISEIVRALKSYSYLDQGPVQTIDVHEGLENTLVIMRHKLRAGVTVRREYVPNLPRIQAHGSELNQVWTNLIDNAVYAMDGQGEITLRTRQDGRWVIIEVEDNGPGIPMEIQPRIFDAFFTTKPPGSGSGLGLNLCYKIVVHQHRGDIKLNSQPGRTCFQVWLPTALDTPGQVPT